MPIVNQGKYDHEANSAPGHDGRVGVPVVDLGEGAMTAGTESCFPLDDGTKRVAFALEGPYHG